MRYLIGALLLLCTTMYATAALADGPPVYRETVRIERTHYLADYDRQLRRDFARFKREEARKRRARAAREAARREAEFERYVARKARARRSKRFYEREGAYVERYAPRRARKVVVHRYDEDRYAALDREERYRRAESLKRCAPTITGHGVDRLTLRRAEESALKAWGKVVARTYGRDYINPRRAMNPRMLCDPACAECTSVFICKYRAAPCRAEF